MRHLVLCSLLITIPVAAQTGETPLALVDLSIPPASSKLRPYKPPAVSETKLPNGLTVVLAEDSRFPLVTERLVFLAGNKRDPKDTPGLAASVAATLPQMTTTRISAQIPEDVEELGGTLSVYTSADALTIDTSVIAENAIGMLALISDISRNAVFAVDEADFHSQVRQSYLVQHSQSSYLANEEFRKSVYGDAPYAHVGPTADAINRIDSKALRDFRDSLLVPNNAFLILVGKLPARPSLLKAIANEFGSWEAKPVPAYIAPRPMEPKQQLILIDRPGSTQAEIRVGKPAATYRDSGFFPEIVAAMIEAGGPDSRLLRDVREQHGYAYEVRADVNAPADAGALSMVAQVRNDLVAGVLKRILGELERIARERVEPQELTEAKNYANGVFLAGIETQKGVADKLALIQIMNLPRNYFENYATRINSVDLDQVALAAQKYMGPDNYTIVVVGDASKLQQALGMIGTFRVKRDRDPRDVDNLK